MMHAHQGVPDGVTIFVSLSTVERVFPPFTETAVCSASYYNTRYCSGVGEVGEEKRKGGGGGGG